MTSTQHLYKLRKQQPKSHKPNPDVTFIADEPVEQHQTKFQPDPTLDKLPLQ